MVAFELSTDESQSTDPSLLRGLNEEQQSRLTKLLDEYLVGLENGESLDADEIVRQNPDLGPVFHAYLEKLRALYGVAAGMQPTLDAPSVPLPADKQLGDFLLHHEIGRGGMGVVYEASQQSLDRRVAIKLLPVCCSTHISFRFTASAAIKAFTTTQCSSLMGLLWMLGCANVVRKR